MATGALDANGIWQYGEDDSEATFSGLLNKLASSTSDTVTRLEGFTGYTGTLGVANGGTGAASLAAAQNNLGIALVPIVPTSVNYSGGSAPSVTAMGEVFGSGKTSISLNGVFTSAFRFYRVNIYSSGDTNRQQCFRLRAAGVDSTTNYNWTELVGNFSIVGRNTAGGTGEFRFATVAAYAEEYSNIELSRPNDVNSTTISAISSAYNASGQEIGLTAGLHNLATAYDGITFLPTAGTCTYLIQVLGYNHS